MRASSDLSFQYGRRQTDCCCEDENIPLDKTDKNHCNIDKVQAMQRGPTSLRMLEEVVFKCVYIMVLVMFG